MNIRNPIYNEHGSIDCELEHPDFGWIPFTASPDDSEQHGRDIYAALIDSGNIAAYSAPVPPEPTAEELATKYRQDRKAEYPSVSDQLDMIYWDKVNNTNEWQTLIESIKTKYPKI